MEHEDNAHLDNFLQNSQHLMENLQMDRGDGVCDNVAVDEIGGKFEVHEEHEDEEEWKYIKEGQQSEKQQQQQQQQQQLKAGVACKDVEGVKEVGNGHGYGYEHGDVGADDILLLDHHEVGNGVVGISAAVNADADNAATGIVENEEVDVEIIKNDGDFSTTSNTTSTAGEDGYADTGVLQVQMQIQNIPQDEFLPKQVADLLEECPNIGSHADETEEDDPSSLATNNTNRTNSLSESAPNQELQQLPTEENIIKSEEFSNENKEHTVPLITNVLGDIPFEETTGNSDFDSEMHSQLNPNAIEFVPSFGSNPTSPTTGNSDNQIFVDEGVASNSADEIQLRAQPNSLPRHLLGDDDFVAHSPRKGSAESNLDAIALPEENDFEHEAAKRPHELEQEDDLISVGAVEHTQQQPELTNEHLQSLNNYAANMFEIERDTNEDYSERLNQSPLNLIDHGPETSVDLEMDLQPVDVEKDDETQEIPKENLEIIEDVFNTVQPLPIDLNTSFVEESSQQGFTAEGKELLDVEEKENISHSPSTEEMQMNLQNEFHSSVKDIPQIPIDMDNAANMQESFYLESTSSEARQQLQEPFASGIEFSAVDESNFHTNEIEITNAEKQKPVLDHPSFDIIQISAPGTFEFEPETALDTSPTSLNIYAPEFTPTPKSIDADIISPSPVSTEEKHLIEETKEQAILSETKELEQKMDDLIVSSNDGILSQVEEVAQTAANIVESLNPFAASEPEQHETVEETPIEANQVFSTESQPDADFSQQNEQSYHNEQQEQQHLQEETAESTYEHHEDNLLLTKPEDVQPQAASPVQLESELNGFEEHVPATLSVESNIAAPVEPESVELPVEPAHEYSHVDLLESRVAQPEHEDRRVEFVASPVAEPEHEVPVESPVAEPEHVAVSEPELKDVPQAEVQPVSEPKLIAQPEPEVEVLPSKPVIVLDESSNFDANVSAVAEPILESPDQHSASIPSEANVELAANESTASAVEETVITAAAVGALAATVAAVTVAADAHKKTDVKQARTPTSTKSKTIDVKKAAEPAKKPIGKTSLSSLSAARPRTAPVKTTATADKKPTTTTTATKSATTTAARKPLTSATAAYRTVTKTTTTTRPATAPTAAKLTASRTTTTTTARRSVPTTTGASMTATNGTATAKPKPTSGAPTKPTTLGLSGTTKPKLSSPRTTLTSQLRKAPINIGTGVAASKSPLKTTAPTANDVTKSSTTTTTASRAKSSTSTTTTTTTTKTFTARPAPKTTHPSTLTSTTTRRTLGSVSVSATAAKASSSTLLKKTPPGLTRPATTGKSSLSPTKTASSVLKAKTKDVTKKAVTPTKSSKELKEKHTEEQTKTNGTTVVGAEEPAVIQSEQKPHLNGNGDGDALQLIENGIHKLELENGENPLLEQHIQASLIDA